MQVILPIHNFTISKNYLDHVPIGQWNLGYVWECVTPSPPVELKEGNYPHDSGIVRDPGRRKALPGLSLSCPGTFPGMKGLKQIKKQIKGVAYSISVGKWNLLSSVTAGQTHTPSQLGKWEWDLGPKSRVALGGKVIVS